MRLKTRYKIKHYQHNANNYVTIIVYVVNVCMGGVLFQFMGGGAKQRMIQFMGGLNKGS